MRLAAFTAHELPARSAAARKSSPVSMLIFSLSSPHSLYAAPTPPLYQHSRLEPASH